LMKFVVMGNYSTRAEVKSNARGIVDKMRDWNYNRR